MVDYSLTEKEKKARSMVCLPLDGLVLMKENKKKSEDLSAEELIEELSDFVGWFKFNDQFTASGQKALQLAKNARTFLDMKFYDIPNTAKNHAYQATVLGVGMLNVHATGGLDMMKEAIKGVEQALADNSNLERPKVYGVTVLTSYDLPRLLHTFEPLLPGELQGITFVKYFDVDKLKKDAAKKKLTDGQERRIEEWDIILKEHDGFLIDLINRFVYHLAELADAAGLDGIVCSAKELDYVRPRMRKDFLYVTPGIEAPKTGKAGADQARTFTPAEAVKRGSNILVVGRAITGYKTADERRAAAYAVLQDIADVL